MAKFYIGQRVRVRMRDKDSKAHGAVGTVVSIDEEPWQADRILYTVRLDHSAWKWTLQTSGRSLKSIE